MKNLLLWLLLCPVVVVKSQNTEAYVDYKIQRIPTSETYSTAAIAKYVRANFSTSRERFRAIYTWVTGNIKYDTDSMYVINWNQGREARVTEALRRRKGVCENYAAIFNDIAIKSGLTSFIVDGYTKQGGRVDRSGHSWCAVQLDGDWLLCDPTWDKDASGRPNYFLVPPSDFILSHMPFDPMWQLLDYPLSHADFYKGAVAGNRDVFHFADSITAFSRLSELQQLEASVSRMRTQDKPGELVKNRIAYTNMLIGIIYEEKDRTLYNGAVADLNKAAALFNDIVQYRNNQFLPVKTAEEVNVLFTRAEAAIAGGFKNARNIGTVVPNPQYDPAELINRLEQLSKRLTGQKVFINNHLMMDATEKKKL